MSSINRNSKNLMNANGLPYRETVAIATYYALNLGGLAFVFSFSILLLKQRGLSFVEIAVLMAVSALAGGLAQIKLGHLSDVIGSRKGLTIACTISAGASYILYGIGYTFWAFLPLFIWSGVSTSASLSLPQAIISDWTTASGSTARAFAVTRAFGTVGFLIALLLIMVFPVLADGTNFIYGSVALYIISAVPLLLIREAPVTQTSHSIFKGSLRVLKSQRAYIFVLCYGLFRLCETGVMGYIGLYMKELGGDTRLVATTFWISAAAELPLIFISGKLSDRVGRRLPLMIPFLALPIRMFLYSMAKTPTSILYVQAMHGLTFGIMVVCAVAYMSDIAPRDLRGTAQGVLSITNSIASAVGPLIIGCLGDVVGLAITFRIIAVLATVSMLLFMCLVREPKHVDSTI